MNKLTPFALAISIAGLFTACQKDNDVVPNSTAIQQADLRQNNDGYSVQNGRLVFVNQAAFQQLSSSLSSV